MDVIKEVYYSIGGTDFKSDFYTNMPDRLFRYIKYLLLTSAQDTVDPNTSEYCTRWAPSCDPFEVGYCTSIILETLSRINSILERADSRSNAVLTFARWGSRTSREVFLEGLLRLLASPSEFPMEYYYLTFKDYKNGVSEQEFYDRMGYIPKSSYKVS